MNPIPLRIRIPRALELAPMTVRELARCLSVSPHAVWSTLQELEAARARNPVRRNGHPGHLYRIAA
jgi:predicted ArsR family transcriptional regulator